MAPTDQNDDGQAENPYKAPVEGGSYPPPLALLPWIKDRFALVVTAIVITLPLWAVVTGLLMLLDVLNLIGR